MCAFVEGACGEGVFSGGGGEPASPVAALAGDEEDAASEHESSSRSEGPKFNGFHKKKTHSTDV